MTSVVTRRKPSERAVPPFGGFSPQLVELEIHRLLRNRRTIIFSVLFPVFFFLVFGLNSAYANLRVGQGNTSAFIMISMALYGAVISTSGGAALVATERVAGWSRQLRITPLHPLAYIAVKMATSLVLGAASVAAVYITGAVTGKPYMPVGIWVTTGVVLWVGSLLFAAFGLFIGYLLPSEYGMQVIGFALMLFSFGGGLFIPLSQFSHLLRQLAAFTPLFGLNQVVHYPLVQGSFDWTWAANLLAWLIIFTGGAVWRFRKDTARV